MPLKQSPSKKAFESNLKTEMHAGKPQDQSLAIAYSVKRKNKRKYADGGTVDRTKGMQPATGAVPADPDKRTVSQSIKAALGAPTYAEGGEVSAKTEKRPMPGQSFNDSESERKNKGRKPASQDQWTDTPTERQATNKPKTQPITRPRMVPSNAFSTRLYNKEGHLEDTMPPDGYANQPENDYNEEDAKKTGKNPDMAKPHTMAKAYAKGGQVTEKESEDDNTEHPAHLEDDNDQMQPSDDYMSGEMEAHNYAEGGSIEHDMDDQDTDEINNEHYDSIVATIMAKRRAQAALDSGSGDMDEMVRMYTGGQVEDNTDKVGSTDGIFTFPRDSEADLDLNSMEQPNGYYKRNEDAALKENYDEDMHDMSQPEDSNEHGDQNESDSENEHDDMLVSSIRRKMKAKQGFR